MAESGNPSLWSMIKEEWNPKNKGLHVKKEWNEFKDEFKRDPEESIISTLLQSRSEYKQSYEKPSKSSKKKLSKEEKKAKKNREKAAKGKIKHAKGKALCNASKPLANNGGRIFKRGARLFKNGGKRILKGLLKITRGVAELAIAAAKIAAGAAMVAIGLITCCTVVGAPAGASMISNGARMMGEGFIGTAKALGRIGMGMAHMLAGMAQATAGMAIAMTGRMMQMTGKIMNRTGLSMQRKGNEMMKANGQEMSISQENVNTDTLNQTLNSANSQAAEAKAPSSNSNEGASQPTNNGQSQEKGQEQGEIGLGGVAKEVAMTVGTGVVMNQLAKGQEGKKAKIVDMQAEARNDKNNPLNSISAKKWDAIQKKQDKVKKRYDVLMQSGQQDKAAEELARFEQQLSGKGKKGDFGLNKEQMAAFKDANKDKFAEWQPKKQTQARTVDMNVLAQNRAKTGTYGM